MFTDELSGTSTSSTRCPRLPRNDDHHTTSTPSAVASGAPDVETSSRVELLALLALSQRHHHFKLLRGSWKDSAANEVVGELAAAEAISAVFVEDHTFMEVAPHLEVLRPPKTFK